ncbi:MAG: thioredoxin reductase (NADPH) [Planctomycetota bacterium]|jgi:thioredoxin reductase (NADPH)
MVPDSALITHSSTMTDVREVIIIGSGPAGYTAALYTARANLKPLLFQGMQPGGQLTITTDVENFPGYPDGVLGPDMMEDLKKQAERFGTEINFEEIIEVDFSVRPFRLKSDFGEYFAKSIIISTGASARLLGLEAEKKLMGYGVSACATCDGAFFPDKEVLIVGGGDTAMEEAQFLTRYAKKVSIVFRASKIMLERAQRNPKIDWILNSTVTDIKAGENGKVSTVVLEDTRNGEQKEVETDGIFIAIGHSPNSGIFKGQIDMDENNYVIVHEGTCTTVEGVFACGDVMDHRYRQAVTAAGTGCMAAIDAERWLEAQED